MDDLLSYLFGRSASTKQENHCQRGQYLIWFWKKILSSTTTII